MNQRRSLRTLPAMIALALAVIAACVGASERTEASGLTTPAVRRPGVDRGIGHWTRRTTAAPNDPGAWTSLGDTFMQKARESAEPTYYRRAEAAYRKALEVSPRHVGALAGMAWVQGALHEFEESVAWAKKALAVDPAYQPAYGLLGDAAVETGNYDLAFEHYQKMLDLRPDLASYSRAAQLLWVTGNQRKAIWMMGKAVDAGALYAENTAWARVQLALMLWSQGALLSAEQILEADLAATPNSHHVLAALAKVKTSRKNYPEAIGYYKQAIAAVPQFETVVALGDLYSVIGRKEEAEQQYALVEMINRLNRASGVRTDLQMARFYADHDQNVADATRETEAVSATRKTVYAFDTLAWCYYKGGRYDEARRAIQKALARRTPDAEILFHAGMIYAKLGERVKAQQFLYEALSTNPHFHPAHAATAAETLAQLGSRPVE
jgi:tetratricopeptide (TPR) repeat protein